MIDTSVLCISLHGTDPSILHVRVDGVAAKQKKNCDAALKASRMNARDSGVREDACLQSMRCTQPKIIIKNDIIAPQAC